MPDGSPPSPDASLLAYLSMLADLGERDRFLELRWRRRPGRMQRRFVSTRRVGDAAALVSLLAPDNDVYVGVAQRDGDTHGGRAAISGLHLAYIESDSASTAMRLSAFAHPPSVVIASGSPGHHQVYWRLDRRYPPAEVQSANRRLALALDADPACSDVARILRPPHTLNHKHDPPRAVTLLVLREHLRYTLPRLTAELPADESRSCPPASARATRVAHGPLDRALLAIPAAEYVRVLVGSTPNGEGKICCPFHEDRDPSLHLYADGGFYCFGSGCGAGGSIYDFAARLWGIPPKGAGFIELRRRLAQQFRLRP